jgi:hypothetical protein
VSGLLSKATGVFVEPATAAATPAEVTRVAVLGVPAEARPLAAAIALGLNGVPVVAGWRLGRTAPGPATIGARRLAARLARREIDAAARGRLVWVELPDEAEAAAVAARRLDGTLVEQALVTALAGPRVAPVDELLEDAERIVVAADPASPLARVVLARLPRAVATPAPTGLARSLALAGWAGALADGTMRRVA